MPRLILVSLLSRLDPKTLTHTYARARTRTHHNLVFALIVHCYIWSLFSYPAHLPINFPGSFAPNHTIIHQTAVHPVLLIVSGNYLVCCITLATTAMTDDGTFEYFSTLACCIEQQRVGQRLHIFHDPPLAPKPWVTEEAADGRLWPRAERPDLGKEYWHRDSPEPDLSAEQRRGERVIRDPRETLSAGHRKETRDLCENTHADLTGDSAQTKKCYRRFQPQQHK